MLSLGPRTHGAALLTALIGVCVLAAPAGAATKPYSVVIAPGTAVAGATVAFQATITNRTTSQTLGSANLTAPTGFIVRGASVGGQTQAVSGSLVQLRNFGIAPGASVIAMVTASVPVKNPCAAATFTWKVAAKQSNDFNGTGNDFGPLENSSLTTSTTCDGTGFPCTKASCTGSATLPGLATLTVNSPGSTGRLTIDIGNGIDCAGYNEILPNDFIVDFVPDLGTVGREKRVTIAITKAAMQASTNNGLAQVNVCFGVPAPGTFLVKPGTAPLQPTADGFNIGLLPDCGVPPCVASRQSVGGGATIVVRAPGGGEDPRYGP